MFLQHIIDDTSPFHSSTNPLGVSFERFDCIYGSAVGLDVHVQALTGGMGSWDLSTVVCDAMFEGMFSETQQRMDFRRIDEFELLSGLHGHERVLPHGLQRDALGLPPLDPSLVEMIPELTENLSDEIDTAGLPQGNNGTAVASSGTLGDTAGAQGVLPGVQGGCWTSGSRLC